MSEFKHLRIPKNGESIGQAYGEIVVPTSPIIPFIEGDGIGRDIMRATRSVVDAAILAAYAAEKRIIWLEILAGQKAYDKYGEWLPEDTLKAIEYFQVALKGPLTTPIGGGFRSLNVTLRQKLDLYACVRPVRYFDGIISPVKNPEQMDIVVFRENSEDVYAGLEWEEGSEEAIKLIEFLKSEFDVNVRKDSGIGIKPISITATQRLTKMAIEFAIKNNRKNITFVHKGNIMKFTEGSFANWGYELAKDRFSSETITEEEVQKEHHGQTPEGQIVLKDRIADSMFQQILTRTSDYDVLVTPNLNGDYLSDACAAQVGGIGMAPGGNIGDRSALFEATHGTAPKYADQNVANPSSLILSAVMMLRHIRWNAAADLIENGIERAISKKLVTHDLARMMENATQLSTSEFSDAIIDNFKERKSDY